MSRVLAVKAHPKASRDRVEPDNAGGYQVWCTAPPDRGAANVAIRKLLADHLGVSPSKIELIRGATSRYKMFEVLD